MLHLRPYVKSEWRKNIGDLVSDEEKRKFEWWLCGQPFFGDDGEQYLSLPKNLSLFDEKTGESYRVVKTPQQPRVYIVNLLSQTSMMKALKAGAIGIAFLSQRKECVKCDDSIVCYEAIIALPKSSISQTLERIEDPTQSRIITFSLKYNTEIQRTVPNFPSHQEIRSVIAEGYSAKTITKVLYEYLLVYFSRV